MPGRLEWTMRSRRNPGAGDRGCEPSAGIDPAPPKESDKQFKTASSEKIRKSRRALLPSRPSKVAASTTSCRRSPPQRSLGRFACRLQFERRCHDPTLTTAAAMVHSPHRAALKTDELIANLDPFDGVLEFEKLGIARRSWVKQF